MDQETDYARINRKINIRTELRNAQLRDEYLRQEIVEQFRDVNLDIIRLQTKQYWIMIMLVLSHVAVAALAMAIVLE